MTMETRVLAAGVAGGEVLTLLEPLSFWGGFDAATGRIVDTQHPQRGALLSGRVLLMSVGRGSSSSSAVLAEAIRLGTAPTAIVLARTDVIVALGSIVARELYGKECPVVSLDAGLPPALDGQYARVEARAGIGTVSFVAQPPAVA